MDRTADPGIESAARPEIFRDTGVDSFCPSFSRQKRNDEETDNQLARYHQQINAQRSSHRLIQSLEDQAQLKNSHRKDWKQITRSPNDQLDRQTNPRTIRVATRKSRICHSVLRSNMSEVITISEPLNDPMVGGNSWLGSPSLFLREFKPVKGLPSHK